MIDKSKRYLKTRMALDTLSTLEGKRIILTAWPR